MAVKVWEWHVNAGWGLSGRQVFTDGGYMQLSVAAIISRCDKKAWSSKHRNIWEGFVAAACPFFSLWWHHRGNIFIIALRHSFCSQTFLKLDIVSFHTQWWLVPMLLCYTLSTCSFIFIKLVFYSSGEKFTSIQLQGSLTNVWQVLLLACDNYNGCLNVNKFA